MFKLILVIEGWEISYENAPGLLALEFVNYNCLILDIIWYHDDDCDDNEDAAADANDTDNDGDYENGNCDQWQINVLHLHYFVYPIIVSENYVLYGIYI